MKKSVIIPILFSLLILAANLYAQTSTEAISKTDDTVALISKKIAFTEYSTNEVQYTEPEKIVEYTLEDFEEISDFKVVLYDIQGNEVFTLTSKSKIAIDKLPKNANLLMEEGKTTYFIVDQE